VSSLEITGLLAIILISAFALVGIIVAIPIFRLINRIRLLVEKLNESLIPLVENLNSTVSHLNSEISSISDLTQSAGSIVEQFEKIIRLARIIITNPIIKLISTGIGFADGIKKAVGKNNKNNSNKGKEEEAKNEP
jgi:predicted PurR-regulated permease PerM